MRFLMAMLLAGALTLFASAAFASSAYDDVPADHWAYNALDYLTQRGVLEGYPDGFFKGDRTLTRYEFAQAVARLLDTIQAGNVEEQIKIMADTLRAEFSDQLAEMSKQIDAMNGQINDVDSRVGDLEGKLKEQGDKIGALDKKIADMKPGPDWKGSFRYRWQHESQGDGDRFRQRISFMLGYNKKVNDITEIGFRLKTQTGADPTSGNYTLGSKDGKTADIFLDRAYVKYTPSWFGYYTDAECNCQPKLDIYAGIYPNITYDPNQVILDSDQNLQGIGAVYHFNADFQLTTAMSVITEKNTGEFEDDAVLYATELYHKNFLSCGLDAWLGCYGWKNESALPAAYFEDNGLRGFDFNNNGTIGDTGDRFSTNFNTVKAGLQYTFDCVWDKPLAIYGEYFVNIDSDAEDRIGAVNPFITPDIIYESTDDTGFVIGTQWGESPKAKGDWSWWLRYKEVGANAVIDGLSEGDGGDSSANTNAFKIGFAYGWADNSVLGVNYFINKMNNAFGFGIPAKKDDQSVLQLDWTFKF